MTHKSSGLVRTLLSQGIFNFTKKMFKRCWFGLVSNSGVFSRSNIPALQWIMIHLINMVARSFCQISPFMTLSKTFSIIFHFSEIPLPEAAILAYKQKQKALEVLHLYQFWSIYHILRNFLACEQGGGEIKGGKEERRKRGACWKTPIFWLQQLYNFTAHSLQSYSFESRSFRNKKSYFFNMVEPINLIFLQDDRNHWTKIFQSCRFFI